jgi:hypothetical protein
MVENTGNVLLKCGLMKNILNVSLPTKFINVKFKMSAVINKTTKVGSARSGVLKSSFARLVTSRKIPIKTCPPW